MKNFHPLDAFSEKPFERIYQIWKDLPPQYDIKFYWETIYEFGIKDAVEQFEDIYLHHYEAY